ncbi:uncharacterized protein LOC132309742 [Cornus florida]|uniref:uncharacterized protein LOC132309742 n=1 Tax=Cornus florida TaxID=4283 RepID=UPI002899AED5|nr:uncharacterized protein LOC132309742 [Cornus florida]
MEYSLLTIISSQRRYQLTCFNAFWLLFLFTVLSTISVSSSTTPPSYSDHCDSIVPKSTPTDPDYTTLPHLLRIPNGRYTGGDKILVNTSSDQFYFDYDKYLSFTTRKVYKTKASDVYNIEAYLTFSQSYYSNYRSRRGALKFLLNGFWSESSGKLCMLGSASWHSREGKSLELDAVLKLNFAKNATILTSLVNGTLESLSSSDDLNYFDPISILAFPSMSYYNYTLVSEELDSGFPGGIDIPQNPSLGLQPGSICSTLSRQFPPFKLEYASECNSSHNCTPFGKDIGYLPTFVSFSEIQCSEDVQKLRYLIDFSNSSYGFYYQPFNSDTTLVAEGSWDGKKNRLCIVACRILNSSDSLGNVRVGDCSIRLSLRYPAVWSIKQRGIVGQIWSNRTVNDSGYFHRIKFGGFSHNRVSLPGLEYEYTQMERVKMLCPVKKPSQHKGLRYPIADSYDMRFRMSVKDSKGRSSWGSADPISVGDQFYEHGNVIFGSSSMADESSAFEAEANYIRPSNISYNIMFYPFAGEIHDPSTDGEVKISGEGIYDEQTGHLCMVGCKKLGSYIQESTNDHMDCEILLKFQFPPLNSKKGDVTKGSIESTRKHSDPLFFEHLNFSATAYSTSEARRSIWRMDLEIIMALISNTLACVFVGLQIFYVKKRPNVLPFTSLVMLVILTLGYMIPLLLNFEALFLKIHNRRNVFLRTGGWLEADEVTVRIITMVAFLLQFRLLQLAWSTRLGDRNQKGLWVAEMKSLFATTAFYISGALMVLFVNWMKNKNGNTTVSSSIEVYQQHNLWGDLRSYGGLVIDGFLFPQILLNIFQMSRENALSRSFYIGTTFVRLLPHAYDLYRAHFVPQHFDGSYIYANPTADFYSTAWDVIIPCGGMFFAVVIFLQQRFGGRCILPRRFRESEFYEKVPVVSNG